MHSVPRYRRPRPQMAKYAVAARTALILDFFLPALNLTGGRESSRAVQSVPATRSLRLSQLAGAFGYSSALVLPLLIFASSTLALFGKPYDSQQIVYALLLSVQWVHGVGRGAVRHVVVVWDARRLGVAVGSGAVAAVLTCALGVSRYGALAAAAASLIGALMVNGLAIVMAFSDGSAGEPPSGSP